MKRWLVRVVWALNGVEQVNCLPIWASTEVTAHNIANGFVRHMAKKFPGVDRVDIRGSQTEVEVAS